MSNKGLIHVNADAEAATSALGGLDQIKTLFLHRWSTSSAHAQATRKPGAHCQTKLESSCFQSDIVLLVVTLFFGRRKPAQLPAGHGLLP